MTGKKRLDSLDALRALACLGILSFHTYLTMLGYVCVSLFFVLSGFLMVYTYYDRLDLSALTAAGCLKFSIRKIKKLYPLHILTMLIPLSEQIYGLLSGLAQPTLSFFAPFAANILLIQAWIPVERYYFSLNIVSWYLSVCLFLYAVFPLILKGLRRFKRAEHGLIAAASVYLVALGVAWCIYSPGGGGQWFLYVCPLFRLVDFFIGCCIGFYFLKAGEKERSPAAATLYELLAIALVVLSEVIGLQGRLPRFLRYTPAFIPMAVMLTFAFAYAKGLPVKLLTNKVTLYIASVSAYVFLIHAVITNLCSITFSRLGITSKFGYIFCVVAASFALAELYRRFENRKKKTLTKG